MQQERLAKRLKRAFTITELVIVIAVIAIMAAVLIPTFANVVEKARVSNDTAVCRNINTLLAMDEAENGKPTEKSDAFDRVISVAEEGGYILENLTPMSTGDIVYDFTSNRIALVDLDKDEVVYSDSSTTIKNVKSSLQNSADATLYMLYDVDGSTTGYNYMYRKVTDASTLSILFDSSTTGVVVSGTITLDSSLTSVGMIELN